MSSDKWSNYRGMMDWNDATTNCKRLGMRLPSKEEILKAVKTGETYSWEKNGIWYWLSIHSESDSSQAYSTSSVSGYVFHPIPKGAFRHVRCIQ